MTPSSTVLRVGTRGSALALAQTESVRPMLERASGVSVEVVTIVSAGDTTSDSLATIGGTGVFASALRDALLAGECDVLVHSLKDLPPEAHPGLVIAAVPPRADARDVLCARKGETFETLAPGARIGTGSPRRRAQVLARRSDLEVIDIRGNVDSRLRRVVEGDFDAVVLAAAGLLRLGRESDISEYLDLDEWPVAAGQGALAIETRDGDEQTFASMDDHQSRMMVDAEREVLRLLEAGCSAPIGTRSMIDDGLLFLTARVYRPDGSEFLTSAQATSLGDSGSPALDLAGRVADELLALGAADLAALGGTR
ncbi:MAG: hydroxymethylbilane synthase [Pseudolysinimonas sp.]